VKSIEKERKWKVIDFILLLLKIVRFLGINIHHNYSRTSNNIILKYWTTLFGNTCGRSYWGLMPGEEE
jgi:hypothetical protein